MVMAEKELHPAVEQFKQFVKRHPKLIQEVQKGNYTWQEFFEEWYLLGEDDARWDEFKSSPISPSTNKDNTLKLNQMLDYVKKVDLNEVQSYLYNLHQAIGALSGVIAQLQNGVANQPQTTNETSKNNLFPFRKD